MFVRFHSTLATPRKSQLAIEYAYQVREESPDVWVSWLHASNATSFERSVRETLQHLGLSGRDDPKRNVFQLFCSWLRNVHKYNKWLLILDGVDDIRFLLEPLLTTEQIESQSVSQGKRCLDYLLVFSRESLLVTTRSRSVALAIVQSSDIVSVDLMDEEHALSLLEKKLGDSYVQDEIVELARELEYMPLAIVQAAEYIRLWQPRCLV